jgi:hypothetical protein
MKHFRLVAALLATAAFALSLAGTSAASDTTAITGVFDRAIAAFNAADMKGWVATCTPTASIIDEIPPHAWQSCGDWWNSFQSFAKENHITAGTVKAGRASNVMLSGSTAYVEWPATYSYRQSGKPGEENGIFTIAFTKTASGWLMSGWTWTKR